MEKEEEGKYHGKGNLQEGETFLLGEVEQGEWLLELPGRKVPFSQNIVETGTNSPSCGHFLLLCVELLVLPATRTSVDFILKRWFITPVLNTHVN